MVIYTLSSTDPKHYNRIQVKLPVEFASRFVNVCVTSLTSNCNIEVMNEDDYITFLIEDETFRVVMTPYSKLTTHRYHTSFKIYSTTTISILQRQCQTLIHSFLRVKNSSALLICRII